MKLAEAPVQQIVGESKILLVDDSQDNLDTYGRILRKGGHSIKVASNREEALKALEQFMPDLVLLDVKLHNDTGFDVMNEIRRNAKFRYIYIVLISSTFTNESYQVHGLHSGADGYITRPIGQQELLARVHVFIRHKHTLDQLRKSESRFRKIIFKSPDAILIVDEKGDVLFSNPAAAKLFGAKNGELIGKPFGHPIISNELAEIEIVGNIGDHDIGEMSVIDIDWEEVNSYLTTIRNISKRKKVEELLRASEEKYKSLVKSIPTPMVVWTKTNDIIELEDCNNAALTFSKKSLDAVKGYHPEQYYGKSSRIPDGIKKCFHFMKSFEEHLIENDRDSKKQMYLKVSYTYVNSALIMVHIEDQTGQKQLELGIREERDKANLYLNIAASIIIALDREGNITLLNDDGARILECPKRIALGANWFNKFIDEKDRDEVSKVFKTIMHGQAGMYEFYENEIITSKGKRRLVRWHNSLLRDSDGSIIGLLSSGEDITDRVKANKELGQSEIRFRELFNRMHNGVAIYEYDESLKDFTFKDANAAALKIMQVSFQEIRGKSVKRCFPGIEKMGLWKVFQQVHKTGSPKILELSEYKDDRLNMQTENSVYKLPTGEIVSVFNDITARVKSELELKKSMEEISNLTSRIISVREDERKKLSGNIHDDLGQLLTALKMDLTWIKKNIEGEKEKLETRVQSSLSIVDDSIRAVQQISTELRPPVLDHLGLMLAIENYINDFQVRTEIAIDLEFPKEHLDLDPERSISVFRITQEALTNIARHAKADRVKISFAKIKDRLFIDISDNGVGINKDALDSSDSLGLIGMRERVSRYNGKFEISSKRGEGTHISIDIPLGA